MATAIDPEAHSFRFNFFILQERARDREELLRDAARRIGTMTPEITQELDRNQILMKCLDKLFLAMRNHRRDKRSQLKKRTLIITREILNDYLKVLKPPLPIQPQDDDLGHAEKCPSCNAMLAARLADYKDLKIGEPPKDLEAEYDLIRTVADTFGRLTEEMNALTLE